MHKLIKHAQTVYFQFDKNERLPVKTYDAFNSENKNTMAGPGIMPPGSHKVEGHGRLSVFYHPCHM